MAAARFLKPALEDMTIGEICDMLEYPADRKMGDLALPFLQWMMKNTVPPKSARERQSLLTTPPLTLQNLSISDICVQRL